MILKRLRAMKFTPQFIIIYVHAIGVLLPLAYGLHHIFNENTTIGVLSLLASFACAYALRCLITKKHSPLTFPIYFLLIGTALAIASYLYGYQGLIFLFPYTACLFFLLRFNLALVGATLSSTTCVFAALHTMESVDLWHFSSALVISLGLLIYYAYISERERATLTEAAYNDELTGIYNRRYFMEWLTELATERSDTFQKTTLFYIDIDNFKTLNDNYSHSVGDELLKKFTWRVLDVIRDDDTNKESMAENYNFARLAGDEFVLGMTHLPNMATAQKIAARIIQRVSHPFNIGSSQHIISVSIGLAATTENMRTGTLLDNADSAMYQAKRLGKNTFHVYSNKKNEQQERKSDVEELIIQGLENEHFHLAFMPIYNITKKPFIAGYEALLRCDKKYISPDKLKEIIPIAEDSEIIKKLDLWVIESVFKKLHAAKNHLLSNQWIAINISSAELSNPYFCKKVRQLLSQYTINANHIHLEITETKLAPYDTMAIAHLHALNDMGFKLALDDYGTGYTGLSQLLNFPGHYLKIDRCFTSAIGNPESKEEKMIAIILSIANTCGLGVVVEGIETQAQLQYLQKIGCELAQGYYLAKPVHWDEIQHLSDNK